MSLMLLGYCQPADFQHLFIGLADGCEPEYLTGIVSGDIEGISGKVLSDGEEEFGREVQGQGSGDGETSFEIGFSAFGNGYHGEL